MSSFREVDRQTGFLLPPSADEWLPERHLARFVVEVIDGVDLRALIGSYSRVGLGVVSPGDAAGAVGSRRCDGGVFEPEAGARDI
jgi:hypothetical protein